MAPQGTGRTDRALLGQQRSGSYQVTAVPAPRVPRPPVRPRPAVRAQDTLTRSAACRARPGPGGRTRQASPNRLPIIGRHTATINPQPHPHHSEEVPRARKEGHPRRFTVIHGATGSALDLRSRWSSGRGHHLYKQGSRLSSPAVGHPAVRLWPRPAPSERRGCMPFFLCGAVQGSSVPSTFPRQPVCTNL